MYVRRRVSTVFLFSIAFVWYEKQKSFFEARVNKNRRAMFTTRTNRVAVDRSKWMFFENGESISISFYVHVVRTKDCFTKRGYEWTCIKKPSRRDMLIHQTHNNNTRSFVFVSGDARWRRYGFTRVNRSSRIRIGAVRSKYPVWWRMHATNNELGRESNIDLENANTGVVLRARDRLITTEIDKIIPEQVNTT